MKSLKRIFGALLFSFVLLTGSTPAAAETGAVIETETKSSDKTVTLTLTLEDGTDMTSGRVAVFYDTELLELKSAETGGLWDVEDVNEAYSEDGKTGVSYAWASAEADVSGGTLLTLTFNAKDAADGETVEFDILAKELYQGAAAMPETGKVTEDSVKVTFKENSGTPTVKPNNNSTSQASPQTVSSTDTGDHNNAAAGALLLSTGCIVLAYIGRKRL